MVVADTHADSDMHIEGVCGGGGGGGGGERGRAS